MHITETMASGVLKYLQEVVRAESSDDVEHFIVYSPNREYTPKDLNKHFFDSVSLIEVNIGKGSIQSIKSLYAEICKIKPDVIHLHSSIAGFFGRIVTLCFPKVRVFYTPHGYSFLMINKAKIIRIAYWLAESLLSQIKGQIIACSKSEYRYARKLSPLRKHFLLENCIEVFRTSNKSSSQHKQIIGVGRLEAQKDPKLFIEIVAQLKQIDATIKAVWIGDGSLKQECEELNRTLKTDINFTGWISNAETIEYLQDSMVFLQTSKWEGLPYSVLEAFAVGLPIVASDIESHRDLMINSYVGFIAANQAQYIDYILKLLIDEKLRRNISEANILKLEEGYANFCKTLNSIYNNKCV
ncbi:glycosyltransferase [Paenibacillus aceris]|uniref:Glycosyltransferase involved in cell wall biosynthesis n=1 Tax=Paenibacillus aceris TaxID=869555 RepID=A0ABS4I2R3_9BACL|nr:glycosyltransferase [Paenibacillus aceris]MBP1965206.1 glycosyltransferase involved in cell wall biosynthesis [Paenibacillus aceris]NHW33183.1 glycosyltransferase family 4 protein [Paenibacillus aceris]